MKSFKIFSFIFLVTILSLNAFPNNKLLTSGNLTIGMVSMDALDGVMPGDTVTYSAFYYWNGDGPISNVKIIDNLPSEISINLISPQPNTNTGNVLTWNIGTLENNSYGAIVISAIVNSNVSLGTKFLNTITISGDASEESLDDNESQVEIEVKVPSPSFWVFQWGLMEYLNSGLFLTAEKDVPFDLEINYFNLSTVIANDVVLTDSLQDGLEFVSSNPQPTSVNGNVITWNLGTLGVFAGDKITLKLKPTISGQMKAVAKLTSSNNTNPESGNSKFTFTVVNVLQPIVLKPSTKYYNEDSPLILGKNPKIEGMAKAGSKVTIYEGDSAGYFGDLSSFSLNELASVTVGSDRHWEITPTNMNESRKYYLYFQAELNGEKSAPFFNIWTPIAIEINSMFDSAGFDFNHFIIQTGDQQVVPGALGGESGTTPYADIVIKKRFKAPSQILTDTSMWKNHEMKLVITDGGDTYEEILPLSQVLPVSVPKTSGNSKVSTGFDSYDFIYVQKGFGPGAKVEVWCLPMYYTEEGLPLFGLVWVKCHEILIDPAGYVYDLDIAGSSYDWPAVPPENSLITNATVTVNTRTGDDSWEKWDAAATGQVNPQITDDASDDKINIPGYFAFYVPSGQYQVTASAPDYADAVSPILTVVDEPVFYNVGMKKVSNSATGIKIKNKNITTPSLFTLEQNYPNPFNPTTTIGYSLPVGAAVSLKIYDVAGREVGTLINNEFRSAGRHVLQFNASTIASGVYFYRLSAGRFSAIKKFVVLK